MDLWLVATQQLRRGGRCVFIWSRICLCEAAHVCRVNVLQFANPEPEPQQTDPGKYFISWLATLSFSFKIPTQV